MITKIMYGDKEIVPKDEVTIEYNPSDPEQMRLQGDFLCEIYAEELPRKGYADCVDSLADSIKPGGYFPLATFPNECYYRRKLGNGLTRVFFKLQGT